MQPSTSIIRIIIENHHHPKSSSSKSSSKIIIIQNHHHRKSSSSKIFDFRILKIFGVSTFSRHTCQGVSFNIVFRNHLDIVLLTVLWMKTILRNAIIKMILGWSIIDYHRLSSKSFGFLRIRRFRSDRGHDFDFRALDGDDKSKIIKNRLAHLPGYVYSNVFI